MALDRFVVYYKIGDKQTAPGKEYLGVKDGDPVCYVDEAEWGRPLEEILYHGGNPIFAAVQHDRRMKPFFQSVLQGTGDTAGTVDKLTYRPRSHRLPIATLASLAGTPSLEANLRAKDYNVQLINGLTIGEQAFVDATTISNAPRVIDINATTAGDVDVGAGAALTTLSLAYADLGNLTAALIFGLISNVIESALATITETLGGFAFTTTSRSSHGGDAARGYLMTIAHNNQGFSVQPNGPGTANYCFLLGLRSVAGAGATTGFIRNVGTTVECTINTFRNIYNGGGLQGSSLIIADATPIVNHFTNLIYSCTDTGILYSVVPHANNVVENNTVYSCGMGIQPAGIANLFRRNACYANTTDFGNVGAATGANNQSDDATAADVNWGAGTNNQINGDPAMDFESVIAADGQRFLRPIRSGVLRAVNSTYLAANTEDISGRRWDNSGDWIGARGPSSGKTFFFFGPAYR